MDQTEHDAVAALKTAKSKGLTYYEATQTLLKQGYTQPEIEQASYQFPYTDLSSPDQNSQTQLTSDASQAFGEAILKEKTLDNLREEKDDAYLKSLLFGRYIPLYNLKAIGAWANYTAAKNGQPKSKIYAAWVAAMFACIFVLPLSGLLVIKLHLSPYSLIILFPLGVAGIWYTLNRYLRIKS